MIRELADIIARPLLIIFELSWTLGEMPKNWRKPNVTPIFNKGKKEDSAKYWPVSLTLTPYGEVNPVNQFQAHK